MKKMLFSCLLAALACTLICACAEKTLYLPDDLQTIGNEAFANVKVDYVAFPNSLTAIGDSAFQGASFIGIGEPGIYAQDWCEAHGFEYRPYETDPQWFEWSELDDGTLRITKYTGSDERVFIPASIEGKTVSEIGTAAFMTNKTLVAIAIPEGVTTLGGSAFERCSHLREARLPTGLIKIGGFAFSDCPELTEIDLPDSITTIEGGAFGKSTALTTVRLPASLTSTPRGYSTNGPFNGSETIAKVIFPDNMTSLPASVCDGMPALKQVVFPQSLTQIENGAFRACGALERIDIPAGVTTIGDAAFEYCSAMTSITFPDGLAHIGGNCFAGCESLNGWICPTAFFSLGAERSGSAFPWSISIIPKTIMRRIPMEVRAFPRSNAIPSSTGVRR